ncbi:FkbM family methyltransferase [Methylobacterium aquaticum]|uniref:FkbM family methyltransferase n=1 Tax=Methylobacterium aquaticum TaxID=270351 RepID=UPI001932CF63|nr:FkbM family methyltransferase [Methylobacterium aquaticum]
MGEATLYLSLAHNQGSTSYYDTIAMSPQVYGHERQFINVKTMPVDDVNLEIDIWKIDIEGAEIDAIDGASRHLEEFPPN